MGLVHMGLKEFLPSFVSYVFVFLRTGRTWAMAVRTGSYESLFLLNLGRFIPRKKEIQF